MFGFLPEVLARTVHEYLFGLPFQAVVVRKETLWDPPRYRFHFDWALSQPRDATFSGLVLPPALTFVFCAKHGKRLQSIREIAKSGEEVTCVSIKGEANASELRIQYDSSKKSWVVVVFGESYEFGSGVSWETGSVLRQLRCSALPNLKSKSRQNPFWRATPLRVISWEYDALRWATNGGASDEYHLHCVKYEIFAFGGWASAPFLPRSVTGSGFHPVYLSPSRIWGNSAGDFPSFPRVLVASWKGVCFLAAYSMDSTCDFRRVLVSFSSFLYEQPDQIRDRVDFPTFPAGCWDFLGANEELILLLEWPHRGNADEERKKDESESRSKSKEIKQELHSIGKGAYLSRLIPTPIWINFEFSVREQTSRIQAALCVSSLIVSGCVVEFGVKTCISKILKALNIPQCSQLLSIALP